MDVNKVQFSSEVLFHDWMINEWLITTGYSGSDTDLILSRTVLTFLHWAEFWILESDGWWDDGGLICDYYFIIIDSMFITYYTGL